MQKGISDDGLKRLARFIGAEEESGDSKIRKELIELIDRDTEAFNDVVKAFKMPKDTEKQKETRRKAIQEGYKTAAKVPLETAQTCEKILDIALVVAEKGNTNSVTDAAVSAIMAKAGVESAVLNVKINLGSIKDEKFVQRTNFDLDKIQKNATKKTDGIMKIVSSKM